MPILQGGLTLMKEGRVRALHMCGGGPYRATPESPVAFAGFPAWHEWFKLHGVIPDQVIEIPRLSHPWHTGAEAREFIKLAKQKRWERVFIVAPPFHITRCLANAVTFAKRLDVKVRIYCIPGPADPWHENTLYAQGKERLARLDSVASEYKKLDEFYDNDLDLISAREVLEYLAWRDSA